MIEHQCPHCNERLIAGDQAAGHKLRCTLCGQPVTVPRRAEAPVPPPLPTADRLGVLLALMKQRPLMAGELYELAAIYREQGNELAARQADALATTLAAEVAAPERPAPAPQARGPWLRPLRLLGTLAAVLLIAGCFTNWLMHRIAGFYAETETATRDAAPAVARRPAPKPAHAPAPVAPATAPAPAPSPVQITGVTVETQAHGFSGAPSYIVRGYVTNVAETAQAPLLRARLLAGTVIVAEQTVTCASLPPGLARSVSVTLTPSPDTAIVSGGTLELDRR